MPWVEFGARFDWYPVAGDRRRHFRFQQGHIALVTNACATQAIGAGAAARIRTPSRAEAAAIKANGNIRPRST